VLVVGDSLVVVNAEPMLRPPAGWDARVRESATRWAWSEDAVFPLEKTVLPNVFPSNSLEPGAVVDMGRGRGGEAARGDANSGTEGAEGAGAGAEAGVGKPPLSQSFLRRWGTVFVTNPGFTLRLLLLVGACWVLAVGGSLVPALLPFVLGRGIFFALRLPTVCCHDPLAYFVGNFTMQRLIQGAERLQGSVYGRLGTLWWNWHWQRLLPRPADKDDGEGGGEDEDGDVARSRVSPAEGAGGGGKRTAWGLAWQLFLSFSLGGFVLPLCIGLTFNACLLLRPWGAVAAATQWFVAPGACEVPPSDAEEDGSLVVGLVSLLVRRMGLTTGGGSGEEGVASLPLLLLKELARTVLFGQMMMLLFVVLVLSRDLKRLLARVGVAVLRADTEGPPSPAEQQQEVADEARRARHWLLRWHLLVGGDPTPFMDRVKGFEWEVDCFAAAFVRCTPKTVMQDHFLWPRPLRTSVTTLELDVVLHHAAEAMRTFNAAFVFAPQACWLIQYVLITHCFAILPLVLRLALSSLPLPLPLSLASSSSGAAAWHSFELNVLLPLLVLGACWSWLDDAVGAGRHLARGWTWAVAGAQKTIKDDCYLIGRELQNSVQVRCVGGGQYRLTVID
jgi:hypothetical protein